MLTFVFITTVLYTFTTSASTLASRSLLLHEKRDTQPASFANQGPAHPDATLSLRIALVQPNVAAGLQDKLMEVSTPGNAAYGQYLSKEEVLSYISPEDSVTEAIRGWLSENNLTATQASPAGDWITFTTSVKQANTLLDANFTAYSDTQTGDIAIRTLAYSLPAYLKDHVDFIHPTISFPGFRTNLATSPAQSTPQGGAPSACDQGITPTCLQQHYNLPTTAATHKMNRIAVTGLGGQVPNESDLQLFLQGHRSDINLSTTYNLTTLDGGLDSQTGYVGDEANLDVQYTVGLATGVPVTFISVGNQTQDDASGWVDIALSLVAEDTPPTVWTTSYGNAEYMLSRRLAERMCNAYALLGLRGTSVLFASGDGGASGPQPNNSCSSFVPTFPSGCPYVTSVGATNNTDPEVAASLSAGGFSNYFSTPSYQTSAIAGYISKIGPAANAGLFNASGRGYPDVAAIGANVAYFANGKSTSQGGTSFSSPIFASIIALLNEELLNAGKPQLGFLNPWLYTKAAMEISDITTGHNPGCNTAGFQTMSDWDPVTGLGSPNFANLRIAAGLT